ncbi:MAG: hypothetical protein R3D71_03355 [Rickettsiales bacterium]
MNLWIVVAIAIPVCLLLFFGSNPFRDYQDRSKEIVEKYGSDPLAIQTNMYIEQNQQSGGYMMGFGEEPQTHLNAPSTGDMLSSIKDAAKDNNVNEQQGRGGFGFNRNGYGNNISNNKNAINNAETYEIYNEELKKSEIRQKQKDRGIFERSSEIKNRNLQNYYPPVVKNVAMIDHDQQPKADITGKELRLRSGQPIIFDGIKVYTTDSSGTRRTMPDGSYILQDGSSITITDGVRSLTE